MIATVTTAVRASRHVEALPPHASHLPERFGLFTLILLGESEGKTFYEIQEVGEPFA